MIRRKAVGSKSGTRPSRNGPKARSQMRARFITNKSVICLLQKEATSRRLKFTHNIATMKALIALLVGASFLLGACNTVEGVGKDVQSGGRKIQQEADEHR